MLASQTVDANISVAFAHIQRMSCWQYHHCWSVRETGLSSWWKWQAAAILSDPCGTHSDKVTVWRKRIRQIPNWSQKCSRIVPVFWQTVPRPPSLHRSAEYYMWNCKARHILPVWPRIHICIQPCHERTCEYTCQYVTRGTGWHHKGTDTKKK